MADPFQNVDAAGPEFIKMFADSMDVRQSDPTMERIVAGYLDKLELGPDARIIEIGAGAGAVSRRIAEQLAPRQVIGYEPSQGFVEEARIRAKAHSNLTFECASGTALPIEDAQIDAAIMHTVLTHVTDPGALLAEAARVLKAGGMLIVCDADFSKATFANFPGDPLDICAKRFQSDFVTDPHLVGKLRGLIQTAGLSLQSFDLTSRVVSDGVQMRPWVEVTTANMTKAGEITPALADALLAEHDARAEAGQLYGYQAFATAIARKP